MTESRVRGAERSTLRILNVIGSLAANYGGPSAALPEMAAALVGRGHEVEVMTTNRGDSVRGGSSVIRDGCKTTFYDAPLRGMYAFSPALAHALRTRLSEFDIVHLHSLYLFHTAAAAHYARRIGVPYIIRPHGTLDRYHRQRHRVRKGLYDCLIESRNLARASGIHYMSEAERDQAQEAGIDTPGYVVPHGVVVPELGDQVRDRNLVLFLGRLAEKKGLLLLLDAFARVRVRRPSVHLVVAGPDDGMRGAVLTRVADLGLTRWVDVRPSVHGEAKWRLLASAAVFVLPSAAENFGVSVVEAMAAGTPVVVSREVGVADRVARAQAGLVVPRNAVSLADAIVRILDAPAWADALGTAGRQLAGSVFSWSAIAAQLEGMYREVIAGAHGAAAPGRQESVGARIRL